VAVSFPTQNLQRYHEAAEDFQMAQLLDPNNQAFDVNFRTIHEIRYCLIHPPGEEEDY
jgi:hypothetical protein